MGRNRDGTAVGGRGDQSRGVHGCRRGVQTGGADAAYFRSIATGSSVQGGIRFFGTAVV